MHTPIYLIGFMGAGKSYTGRQLADYMQQPFADLDDLIEATAGQAITTIFAEKGENHFRKLEAKTLRESLGTPIKILATGGGTPCYYDSIKWMNDHGLTIFLDVPEDILVARLEKEAAHRPVLQTEITIRETVRQKMAERRAFYEQAHVHLRPTTLDADLAVLIRDKYLNIVGH